MEEKRTSRLPDNWAWTTLGAIHLDLSRSIDPTETPGQSFELYSVPRFQDGKPEIVTGKEIGSNKLTVEEETVLLCKINPRINRVWVVRSDSRHQKIASTEWIPFFRLEGLNPKYLAYFMRKNDFRIFLASNVSGVGGSLMRIRPTTFSQFPFPLAPSLEETRVVGRIEELFSFLDAGVDSLRKAQAQLKRYRQAVLKYAFEGKLTREWRKTHRNQIEPTIKLLGRLREAKKGTKFEELPPIDTVDLPILPEEWTWTRIGEIAESMRNGVYKPKEFYGNNGVACLRMYNIENGAVAWRDVKRMNLTPEEIEFYELRPGDVLVNRVNSRELVGKAAAIPVGLERCVFESKNIRLRLLQDYANSKYVSFWFLAYSQKFFSRNAQQTVGMASINQEQLASMPIPLCHPYEQIKAVEEVERLFSIAAEVEKTATESIDQSDRMRQSILKMAFEGKIVSQNPSDEPAEKLLERIKAERTKSKGEKDTNKGRKNKPKQLELLNCVK